MTPCDPCSDALILTGPTGSGKSRLALTLAEPLDAEIVSMDSMALYRRMDILTAKPSSADRARVPHHHLLDVLEPWESASVAWWLERARACCRDITARGKRVLFVGGTALYLKALLHGLFDGPPADDTVRARLTAEAETLGSTVFHARLAAVDPVTAARLHPNDVRRMVRALEVFELTGRPLSSWQGQWDAPPAGAPNRCLWLDLPRHILYSRIDARVDQMLTAGLVEEVRALRAQPISREAAQALGYKELLPYLDGQEDLKAAAERLRTRSRRFAKRQLTWFRSLTCCRPVSEELTFALWGLTMEEAATTLMPGSAFPPPSAML
jgi:tRNA dimethylallyltransferase